MDQDLISPVKGHRAAPIKGVFVLKVAAGNDDRYKCIDDRLFFR
ncbi:hypothetical protein KR100_11450 [Synechococcus sp. KORDI-100]|nr:hypothetical protein KR100_11450 [Synechococcus sp. KORDI-100]